jgi:hypothetical protein
MNVTQGRGLHMKHVAAMSCCITTERKVGKPDVTLKTKQYRTWRRDIVKTWSIIKANFFHIKYRDFFLRLFNSLMNSHKNTDTTEMSILYVRHVITKSGTLRVPTGILFRNTNKQQYETTA